MKVQLFTLATMAALALTNTHAQTLGESMVAGNDMFPDDTTTGDTTPSTAQDTTASTNDLANLNTTDTASSSNPSEQVGTNDEADGNDSPTTAPTDAPSPDNDESSSTDKSGPAATPSSDATRPALAVGATVLAIAVAMM